MSDYEFKNSALAKLYEKFMSSGPWSTVKCVDGMSEAFRECDEKLADSQDQCEHWKTMYGNACGDQDVLKESIRILDTANKRLEQKVRDQENEIKQRRKEVDGLYKELDQLLEEKESLKQKVREQEKEIEDLKKRCEDLRKRHLDVVTVNNKTIDKLRDEKESLKQKIREQETEIEDLRKQNAYQAQKDDDDIKKLDNLIQDLQKEHEELKKDCAYMTNSRDTWRTRAKHAEAEVEELKKKLDLTQYAYNGACKDRNCKAEAVVKLAKKRDELQEENDQLREENEKLRKGNDVLECVIERNVKDSIVNMKTTDQLRKDNEKLDHMLQDLQREYDKLKNDRDRKAEAVVELAKRRDELQEQNDKLNTSLAVVTKDREYFFLSFHRLKKDYEKEIGRRQEKIDELLDENEGLKKKLTETTDILEKINRDRNDWRRRALMTKLTSKLPDVKEEYTMTFTMDKADYKELMNILSSKAFGASPEYTKTFLHGFCGERGLCNDCPLREIKHCNFDTMSDEEIENCYKIAISSK